MKHIIGLFLLFNYSHTFCQSREILPINNSKILIDPAQELLQKNNVLIQENLWYGRNKNLRFLQNDSINTVKYSHWRNDSSFWIYTNTLYKVYNSLDQMIGYYSIGPKDKKIYKIDLELDLNGNVILETESRASDSNYFEFKYQYERTYDDKNRLISNIYKYWNPLINDWKINGKRVFAYDNFGNLSLEELYLYDQADWTLMNGKIFNYHYEANKLIYLIEKTYDSQREEYINNMKFEYEYNNFSNVIAQKLYQFNHTDSIWVNNFKLEYFYENSSSSLPFRIDQLQKIDSNFHVNSRLDSIQWIDWFGFENFSQNKYGYYIHSKAMDSSYTIKKYRKYRFENQDNFGSFIETEYLWRDSIWTIIKLNEMQYDAYKNLIFHRSGEITSLGYSESQDRYLNTYDNQNQLKEVILQDYDVSISNYVNNFKEEYFYNINLGNAQYLHSKNSLKIFPNPSSEKIYILFNSPIQNQQTLKLYTMQGKLVQEVCLPSNTSLIELNIEQHGMYILSYNGHQERISIQP